MTFDINKDSCVRVLFCADYKLRVETKDVPDWILDVQRAHWELKKYIRRLKYINKKGK